MRRVRAVFLVFWISTALSVPIVRAGLPTTCPVETARWAHGPSLTVSAHGSLGIYGSGAVLRTVDLSNPSNPVVLGEITLPSVVYGAEMDDRYAYVAAGEADLRVIDLIDPEDPVEVASAPYGTQSWHLAKDVVLNGELLFVLGGAGVTVYDVSEPTLPTQRGTYLYDGYHDAVDVSVSGTTFVTVFDDVMTSEIYFVDFSNPDALQEIGSFTLISGGGQHYNPTGLLWLGDYVYVSEYNSALWVIDASNPTSPQYEWIEIHGGGQGVEMVVVDQTLVVKRMWGTVSLFDISVPSRPNYLVWLDGDTATDIWPFPPSVLVSSRGGGFEVVSLSTPGTPSVAARVEGIGNVQDLVITGTTGFMMSRAGEFGWATRSGLVALDTSSSGSITLMDRIDGHLSDTIEISANSAYLSAHNAFLVIDVSDLTDLTTVGSSTDYSIGDVAVAGQIAANPRFVYDLTIPSAPVAAPMCNSGSSSENRIELALEHAYHTVSNNLVVCDISNPAVPTATSSIILSSQPKDLLVVRDHLVMTTATGIQTRDLTDPADPSADGQLSGINFLERMASLSNLLFVTSTADDGSILVVDITDLSAPSLACTVPTAAEPTAISVSGGKIYVGFENTGIQIFEIPGVIFADDFERGDDRHWN